MTHTKALESLVAHIKEGYGWVEENMLLIYSEEFNIPWEETRKYFDEHFSKIEIQTMKGWNLCSTLDQIRKDIRNL